MKSEDSEATKHRSSSLWLYPDKVIVSLLVYGQAKLRHSYLWAPLLCDTKTGLNLTTFACGLLHSCLLTTSWPWQRRSWLDLWTVMLSFGKPSVAANKASIYLLINQHWEVSAWQSGSQTTVESEADCMGWRNPRSGRGRKHWRS